MTLEAFIRARSEMWTSWRAAISRAGGRPERLGADGVRRLGTLYRGAAADLALARRRFPSDPVRARLERLVGGAALLVYEGRSRRTSVASFFGRDYWRAVAERPAMLILAWALLLGPALLAAGWALQDPAGAEAVIPAPVLGGDRPAGGRRHHPGTGAVFSVELFTHNIQVTLLGFALGITFGIGTGILLILNGVLLGTIAGAAIDAGNGSAFAEFVIPHGPLELSLHIVCHRGGRHAAGLGARRARAGAPGGRRSARQARRAILIVLGDDAVARRRRAHRRRSSAAPGLPAFVLISVGLGLFAGFWGLVA